MSWQLQRGETEPAGRNNISPAESTYVSLVKGAGAVPDEPPSIETVSSSVNIGYDADDLEIPAFLRKRGEG